MMTEHEAGRSAAAEVRFRLVDAGRTDAPLGGGESRVHRACGLSRNAIVRGIQEIQSGTALEAGRVRRRGAGRKPITVHDPQLLVALDRLIEPDTLGDPESPLRWVCKSTRVLAAELGRQRHPISHVKLAQLLHQQHYSLPGTRKAEEGADHPDRDAQFRHINASVKKALAAGLPVLSVDTKKKELVGNYANAGRQWRPVRQAPRVQGARRSESRRAPRVSVRDLRRGAQLGVGERGDGP